MTTCYFGILARSHSRDVRSIVATRLSIRLTTSRRLKSVVNRDSISDRNTVRVVREAYHGKQFCKLFIGHPLPAGRSGVGRVPSALNACYYAQRASAALIVTEATQVSQQGQGYAWTRRVP